MGIEIDRRSGAQDRAQEAAPEHHGVVGLGNVGVGRGALHDGQEDWERTEPREPRKETLYCIEGANRIGERLNT